MQKGPCQPKSHDFSWRDCGSEKRRYILSWFNDNSGLKESRLSKNAAFCPYCYIFKPVLSGSQGGGDSFVGEGFINWRKISNLDKHVGDHYSLHNKCMRSCENLMKQQQHI